MGFILEHEQPFFSAFRGCNGNADAAGVDFFTFIQILKDTAFFQHLSSDGSHIHHSDRTGFGFFTIDFAAGS